MQGESSYRRLVAALWVLVRTADTRDATTLRAAAEAAALACTVVLEAEGHVILQEREGALLLNGRRLLLGVESYASMAAIAAAIAHIGARELMIGSGLQIDDLTIFARWAGGMLVPPPGVAPSQFLPSLGIQAIAVSDREGRTSPPIAAVPAARGPAAASASAARAQAAPGGSQLRSVFVHNRLIAAFSPNELTDGRTARVVLQVVVDRLLREANGTAALMMLLQDPEAQAHGVHTAVLGTTIGRALGCSDALLTDLACAFLLHHSGGASGKPGQRSAPQACSRWLLQQGVDDLWLRAALVARTCGEDQGVRLCELGAQGSLAAALARIGCRTDAMLRQDRRPLCDVLELLRLEAAAGAFPAELVEAMAAVAVATGAQAAR